VKSMMDAETMYVRELIEELAMKLSGEVEPDWSIFRLWYFQLLKIGEEALRVMIKAPREQLYMQASMQILFFFIVFFFFYHFSHFIYLPKM